MANCSTFATAHRCRSRSLLGEPPGTIAHVSSSDPVVWPFQRSNDSGVGALTIAAIVAAVLAVAGNDWWWHVAAAGFAICFAIAAWRYRSILLAVGPQGVVVRNSLRSWTFNWDEVAGFESSPSLSATGSGEAIRVLRHDGTGVTAMAGSRLSAAEVERDVEWLNQYRVRLRKV